MDAVAIASTAQMDDDEELRDNSDDARSTGESEDNGNTAIDVEEDQEDNDDSTDNPVLVFGKYCHHHIRNVCWGAVVKHLSDVMRESMSGCLEGIDFCLCIHPKIKKILRELDKCFSLPAN